ncbi:iron-containing redox enzyme family protein [Arenibaculum sp.]|uniref:iron-containing redox enzyme family protein n=1 Tax=Arenibaculum sp. TaxID=2865862 RepID=UPI002E12C343|nr:iron-containing redox enzyme family protein [Arenibaculum sp.]
MPSDRLSTLLIDIEADYGGRLALARAHVRLRHEERARWQRAGIGELPSDGRDLAACLLGRAQAFGGRETVAGADEARFVLTQFAPQGLTSGCVLQNVACAAFSHEAVPALAHAVHSWQVGAGSIEGNHGVLYRQWLESVDVWLPDVGSELLRTSADFVASAWDLPAYRLSLSVFPEGCLPEILGATLFDVCMPAPALVTAAGASGLAGGSRYLAARSATEHQRILAKAVEAIALAVPPGGAGQEIGARVAEGFMTSLYLSQAWSQDTSDNLRRDPFGAMVRMIARKARFAVGYHAHMKLNQQPFDELVAGDPVRFVRELGRSRWVRRGRPDDSLLLTRLTAFGGPMFRVFSNPELAVIREWIASLPEADGDLGAPSSVPAGGLRTTRDTPETVARQECAAPANAPANARDLYWRLLNIERNPEARTEALAFATLWLARSARNIDAAPDPIPFKEYSHTGLRRWFDEKAIAQARSYARDRNGVRKSREEVIDEALQLCPMILIDGAWLQRWGNPGLVGTKVGALLYAILSDEIGNGETQLNHPNIYRALIADMGVDLPDFRSREFAHFDRFDDDAFSVPAFWLSVSQFPRRFLPETLGLNLAMELSGVGGAYRTARDELRRHGFSTLFVDLHNTVDNVSTGHSAMALDAVELHMDEAVRSGGGRYAAAQWKRVWVGFRALSPPRVGWKELFARPRYVV